MRAAGSGGGGAAAAGAGPRVLLPGGHRAGPPALPGSRDVGRARFRSKTLRIMSVHDEIADAFVIIRYGFLACPKPSSLKVPVSAKEDPRLALLNYMALLRMAARVVSFK